MFEELPFILGFMMFSVFISYILRTYVGPPLSKLIKALAIVGIIFHELCHFFMCLITNTPRESVSLLKKVESENGGLVKYYGEVKVNENSITFMQSFLVSFAPLYLSFWLFFLLLSLLIQFQVDFFIFITVIFIMVSISLAAAPSFSDLSVIPKIFQIHTAHSFYQIFLAALSILTTWLIFTAYDIPSIHEIYIYLIITGIYFVFKYGIKITGIISHSIGMKYRYRTASNKIRFKRITRSRYKPKKPRESR